MLDIQSSTECAGLLAVSVNLLPAMLGLRLNKD
jgi:hypothetical protein